MARPRLLVALGLALFLAGCASLSGIREKPKVSLSSLEPVEIGLFEQRFLLRLRVQNPNPVDIPINGLSFTVELNGQPFADGLSDKAVTVPAMGEGWVEVQASTNLSRLLKQYREWQKVAREQVDYRISGQLRSATLGQLPFDSRGEVSLNQLRQGLGKARP